MGDAAARLDPSEMVCAQCGAIGSQSPDVGTVVIYAPNLEHGFYPLIPAGEYPLCSVKRDDLYVCPSVLAFIELAIESHPVVRQALHTFTAAIVVFREPIPTWIFRRRNGAMMMATA